ncbi:DUF1707 domain-containing protein [Nocardioides seonyuensis]|uniref:DUF1707 domain-containing protein n=1 Tax=Nocardioides seonyuensis TaxID=2518371 RepID=A0A4V1BMG7_9ACTN|nr:DUF1707 domain-containing protein [Nocardioides seonyuensis]QBX56312.1 DUF1707 domain-containing protein [Nocardioides seonyuensis]
MDPRARIGDAERDRATSELGQHYADGRLDHEEYDERLDAIWSARTGADLAVVFHDLPRQPVPVRPVAARQAPRRRSFPWLPVVFVLIGLSIMLDAPLWLLIFPMLWFAHRRGRHLTHHPHQR